MQGTVPTDGAALLLASLSFFSQQSKPRVICATHCLEVADPQLLPP
jgi:DNA mismatch repair ATPase MutS